MTAAAKISPARLTFLSPAPFTTPAPASLGDTSCGAGTIFRPVSTLAGAPVAEAVARIAGGGYRAPRCTCGHASGDHRHVRRPSLARDLPATSGGVCLVDGCPCREFIEVTS